MVPPRGVQKGVADPSPALAEALTRVGDRWTLSVVAALLEGPRRFGELQQQIPGLASNILTSRLRELERQKLVVATAYSKRPRRADYHLTAAGAELGGALRLLAAWAAHQRGDLQGPHHPLCGTALDVRWWCPTCGTVVDREDEIWI